MGTRESTKRAIGNYQKKNPEKAKYWRYKSYARKFISEMISEEDFQELDHWIEERKKALAEN